MFSTGFSSGACEGRKIGASRAWRSYPSGAIEQQHGLCALGDVAGDSSR
jgi:hypothetical protein